MDAEYEALDENSDNDSSIDDESAMSTNAKDAEDRRDRCNAQLKVSFVGSSETDQ